MSTQDVMDFLNSQGSKAYPFDNLHDAVEGEIVAMDIRQQTDIKTGAPQFWDDGKPKQVLVITLQTELHSDDNDDGKRSVWVSGGNFMAETGSGTSKLTALKDALKNAGLTDKDLVVGGWLRMVHTGSGKRTSAGYSPPKLFQAEYRAPSANVSLDELG